MKKFGIISAVIISIPLIYVILAIAVYLLPFIIGIIIAFIFVIIANNCNKDIEIILFNFSAISAVLIGTTLNVMLAESLLNISIAMFKFISFLYTYFTAQ